MVCMWFQGSMSVDMFELLIWPWNNFIISKNSFTNIYSEKCLFPTSTNNKNNMTNFFTKYLNSSFLISGKLV